MEQNEHIVDYRWGDKYKVQEFIQPKSYEIVAKVANLNSTGDKFVEDIAAFIRDKFAYPLIRGQPSSDGQFLRYHKSLTGYYWKKCTFYMWSFPVEVMLQKLGICIDTANLGTSLLRAGKSDAFTCLGEVRRTSTDELLGYHAWTVVSHKSDTYLLETTIHESGINNMVTLHDAYHKDSDFAQKGDIYYIEHARYNEIDYTGITELGRSGIIFILMGRPLRLLNLYGLERTLKINPKTLYKEWRRGEMSKCFEILVAWRRQK